VALALLVGLVCWGGWLLMVASVAAIRAGDAGASVAYYVDQVARDRHDYYVGHGEAPGVWHGGFAEHLGLSGHVAAADFRAVLEGVDPSTGELLKPRANRVAAWDVTFSPPKSISALWALASDDTRGQVWEAQAAAVDAAVGSSPRMRVSRGSAATASTGRTARSWGSCARSSRIAAPAKATPNSTATRS
jgi:hypothetical protein